MNRIEKKLKLSDEKFKRRIGTTKPVFSTMLEILQADFVKQHKLGGKPPELSVGDKLLIPLKYYREYITMESLADDYHRSKSTVCRSIHWVEEVLAADGRFQLPGKETLQHNESTMVAHKTVAIDVMEHPIERPKKAGRLVFRQEKASYGTVSIKGADYCGR
jgi:hypothetical protein